MKIKIEGQEIEVPNNKNISIELDNGTKFRIQHKSAYGLVVNKYDGRDSSIHIEPRVSNEIILK